MKDHDARRWIGGVEARTAGVEARIKTVEKQLATAVATAIGVQKLDARLTDTRIARLQNRLSELEQQVAAHDLAVSYATEQVPVDESLQAAIDGEFPVVFTYRDRAHFVTIRTVSPYTLRESEAGELTLVGWCHGRDHIRQFRVERISELSPADDDYRYPTED